MEKVKEIAAGKAKSMFTTNNPNELIMEFRSRIYNFSFSIWFKDLN